MARLTQDREDLLRDAKAYRNRIELVMQDAAASITVFAGFREEGGLSLYFGQDPVYQFNSQKELRRAFVDDRIHKAEQGQLVRLDPGRTEEKVEMERHVLSPSELEAFSANCSKQLATLLKAIQNESVEVSGQVPDNAEVLQALQAWLLAHDSFALADTARVS